MMDYSKFSVEELLINESFINYCYGLNENDIKYWENIIKTEPGLINNIEQAKELCLLLAVKVSPAEKVIQLEKLKQEVEQSETYETASITGRSKVRQLWVWAS